MSYDLRGFFAENVVQDEQIEFAVSKRMCDGKGKPIKWQLKTITSKEDEQIRVACTVKIAAKRGGRTPETDINKYLGKLVSACVVYPNLNDQKLQDSYKTMGASELLKVMLSPGEFAELVTKVQEINGFDVSMEEMVQTAKNS